jgi:hypothetical protein
MMHEVLSIDGPSTHLTLDARDAGCSVAGHMESMEYLFLQHQAAICAQRFKVKNV